MSPVQHRLTRYDEPDARIDTDAIERAAVREFLSRAHEHELDKEELVVRIRARVEQYADDDVEAHTPGECQHCGRVISGELRDRVDKVMRVALTNPRDVEGALDAYFKVPHSPRSTRSLIPLRARQPNFDLHFSIF